LKQLTYAEFLKESAKWLKPANKRRLAVLLTGETPEETLYYKPLGSLLSIRKTNQYTIRQDPPLEEEEKVTGQTSPLLQNKMSLDEADS
jgi:hypothetical protein